MWCKILYFAVRRNGWRQLFFYLSNLDIWRFMEYSIVYKYIGGGNYTDKIVDLGGGYSIFPSLFPRNEYVLVDLSENACNYQRAHGTEAIVSDMTRLPFEACSVPALVAVSSIEHVTDDIAVFGEISRVLTDNAIAVITVPFSYKQSTLSTLTHPSWQVRLLHKYKSQWMSIIGRSHFQYFSEQINTDSLMKYYCFSELNDQLEKNNLFIVEHEVIGKKLIKTIFRFLPPGWFIVKDLLLGWPLNKLEKMIFKNGKDACGIVLKIQKKAGCTF